MLRAVRGATSVAEDTSEAIRERTAELLAEVLARNELTAGDLVSIIFTATDDLTADFPAVAARDDRPQRASRCSARARSRSSGPLGRCIRVMVHCYAPARPPDPPRLPARGPPAEDGPAGIAGALDTGTAPHIG